MSGAGWIRMYFPPEQRRRLDARAAARRKLEVWHQAEGLLEHGRAPRRPPPADLPIDATIAELAGLTRRRTGIATPDALIAATALLHRIPLMTRNRRHLDRVDGLHVVGPA